MILVSACLLGHKVKYNGGSNANELLLRYSESGRFLPVCPECLAMLPVPRLPMEIVGGSGAQLLAGHTRAVDANGMETSSYLIDGAQKVLAMVKAYHVRVAIFKEGSPSCGVHKAHDGSFTGRKVKGSGVTTALLRRNGVKIYSEKDMTARRLEALIQEDLRFDQIS